MTNDTLVRKIESANDRIAPYIRRTYLQESEFLSKATGARVFLKLECLQYTGSFKLRGAMNKLLSLTPEERGACVVTASTGNHGAAVAYGAGKLGLKVIVFVPVATLLRSTQKYRGKTVVVVLCGSNINTETLKSVL